MPRTSARAATGTTAAAARRTTRRSGWRHLSRSTGSGGSSGTRPGCRSRTPDPGRRVSGQVGATAGGQGLDHLPDLLGTVGAGDEEGVLRVDDDEVLDPDEGDEPPAGRHGGGGVDADDVVRRTEGGDPGQLLGLGHEPGEGGEVADVVPAERRGDDGDAS